MLKIILVTDLVKAASTLLHLSERIVWTKASVQPCSHTVFEAYTKPTMINVEVAKLLMNILVASPHHKWCGVNPK
jgi:hypothetical protein